MRNSYGILIRRTPSVRRPTQVEIRQANEAVAKAVLAWARGLVTGATNSHGLAGLADVLGPVVQEPMTRAELARICHVSVRSLNRFFTRQGVPGPAGWINLVRVLRVVALLRSQPDLTLISICGPGWSTMSRQMANTIGVRPSEVREQTWTLAEMCDRWFTHWATGEWTMQAAGEGRAA